MTSRRDAFNDIEAVEQMRKQFDALVVLLTEAGLIEHESGEGEQIKMRLTPLGRDAWFLMTRNVEPRTISIALSNMLSEMATQQQLQRMADIP